MPVFSYTALKPDGSKAEGELEASDRPEAFARLDRSGLQPVALVAKKAGSNGESALATEAKSASGSDEDEPLPDGPVRLSRAQVVLFTEELSDLIGAGLQLEPALRIMENREELSALKTVTRILRQEVRDGTSFSNALRRASNSFGDLYCSLAQAGEVSGALATILKRQAQYLLTIQELQSKVLFALIYPSFLFASGVGVAILFITFLIPKLTMLLDNTGGTMPGAAKFVIGLSDFMKGYWWLIIGMLIGMIMFARSYVKAEQNREGWDRTKLGLPIVGPILRTRFYVQFLETLGNLVGNGLTLLRALELGRDATPNLYLKSLLKGVIENVGEGAALSRSLKRAGFFPPLLIDMVAVGEQTGRLSESLERASVRYDKELEKSIEKMSALIQPMVVLLMAGMVGIMAYMMISVIFQTISGLENR